MYNVNICCICIGNGEIDFKEFMATVSVSSRGSPKEKLQWAYSLYDMDNDGTVTLMEVTEMMGVGPSLPVIRVIWIS